MDDRHATREGRSGHPAPTHGTRADPSARRHLAAKALKAAAVLGLIATVLAYVVAWLAGADLAVALGAALIVGGGFATIAALVLAEREDGRVEEMVNAPPSDADGGAPWDDTGRAGRKLPGAPE